ncbi:antitoxin MazE-like protein [Mycobacterium sp.]|uniref:antitoxin MazE-like protein n=1 Tax=Mycobacterium sp. TaxID=1785 RepID=UPI0031D66444
MATSTRWVRSTRRVSDYRRRMRERGYRPVQVWVPDVRSAEFAAEAHREALALAEADRHSDDMDFVEAISDLTDDE